jgi:CRP/FNR family cyclic AMP-dependent transcriptional regulator
VSPQGQIAQIGKAESARAGKAGAASDAASWLNVLAEVPLFAGLSQRHLRKVAASAQVVRLHDGRPITRAGEAGDAFFVVLDGEVSVERPGVKALMLGMGSFFGEMALLDGGPRTATVAAKGPVVCLTISRSRFLKLLRAEPAIAIAMVEELARRLRAVQASA